MRSPPPFLALLSVGLLTGCGSAISTDAQSDTSPDITLLNVSYDPTREFYAEFNQVFAKDYQAKTSRVIPVFVAEPRRV